MKPHVPCPRCGGTGTERTWFKVDPSLRGGWTHNDGRCTKCLGIGKIPDPTPKEYGLFYVESEEASHLPTDVIIDRILATQKREEENE